MNKKKIILYILMTIILITFSIFLITYMSRQNVKNVPNKETSKYRYKNPIVPDGFKKVETDTASWELNEEGNPKG